MASTVTEMLRRRMMAHSEGINFDEWLWFDFTLQSSATINLTTSATTTYFDRLYYDGSEMAIANNMTMDADAGHHFIAWHPSSSTILGVPHVASYSNSVNDTTHIPASITNVSDYGLRECPVAYPAILVCRATIPPTVGTAGLGLLYHGNIKVYVPDASIDAYKEADQWQQFASRIYGISEWAGI